MGWKGREGKEGGDAIRGRKLIIKRSEIYSFLSVQIAGRLSQEADIRLQPAVIIVAVRLNFNATDELFYGFQVLYVHQVHARRALIVVVYELY